MLRFTTTILKFASQGEKTGWTYIPVPEAIAQQLNAGCKKSFRVKGKLDNYSVSGIALLPMGGGNFILPLNATMRKGIGKLKGAQLNVQLILDKQKYQLNESFIACLEDEPAALEFFKTLPDSHQIYFSKWIEAAKTEPTQTKRIAMAVSGLSKKMGYPEMLRWEKEKRLSR